MTPHPNAPSEAIGTPSDPRQRPLCPGPAIVTRFLKMEKVSGGPVCIPRDVSLPEPAWGSRFSSLHFPASPALTRFGKPLSKWSRRKDFPECCSPSTASKQTGVSLANGCFRQRFMAPILRMRPPEALIRTNSSRSALTAQVSWVGQRRVH